MEGSSSIYERRTQGHAGYAVIETLAELGARAADTVASWLAAFAESQRQARARRELRHLSDHFLKDIGLSRHEIDSLFR